MSNPQHLSEIELFELVEGDLPETEAASARAHVAACEECAAGVAALEQARLVLRAAPLLELPEERYREMLRVLPTQEGERPGRRLLAHPRRWLVVLAPVATVAAVVLVVVAVSQNGGGGDEEAAAPAEPALVMQAEEAQADASAAAPGAGEDASAEFAPEAAPAEPPAEPAEPPAAAPPVAEAPVPEDAARETVRSVAGTPSEVAERLQQQGLNARAVDGTVEVEGSDRDVVARAIEDYPDGNVAVIVVPGP
jgi:hypothetical protein